MGILERIFKYDSLEGEPSTSTIKGDRNKPHTLGVRVFGIDLRKGEDMYVIKLGFLRPFIGKTEYYELGDGNTKKYGFDMITGITVEKSWGLIYIKAMLLGFGLYFAFQDGNF